MRYFVALLLIAFAVFAVTEAIGYGYGGYGRGYGGGYGGYGRGYGGYGGYRGYGGHGYGRGYGGYGRGWYLFIQGFVFVYLRQYDG